MNVKEFIKANAELTDKYISDILPKADEEYPIIFDFFFVLYFVLLTKRSSPGI